MILGKTKIAEDEKKNYSMDGKAWLENNEGNIQKEIVQCSNGF